MGSRGPQRKPVDERLVKAGIDPGRRGKKRLEEDAARKKKLSEGLTPEQEAIYIPLMPDYLIPEAIDHWNFLIPQLVAARFIRAVDADILATYCQCMGRAVAYERYLKKNGEFVEKTKVTMTQRPQVRLAREYRKEARELAEKLGLTPKARQAMNISIEPPTAVQSDAQKQHDKAWKTSRRGVTPEEAADEDDDEAEEED